MMHCMGMMGGAMMLAMGVQGLLLIALEILGVIALVRYLRAPRT